MDSKNVKASVLILSGGQSIRMGFPKLLLPYDGEKTFIEQIILVYRALLGGEIVLVLSEQVWKAHKPFFRSSLPEVQLVINSHSELDRMYSIQLGLDKIVSDLVFIQNADNPFVKADLLWRMVKAAPQDGNVSPCFSGKGGHPVLLCGAVKDRVSIATRNTTLRSVLSGQTRVMVDVDDPDVLVNLNTLETYKSRFPANK